MRGASHYLQTRNTLGQNDAGFKDGTNIDSSAITTAKIADGAVTPVKRSGGFYAVFHSFGTGTGSQSITGVGFQPKALIVLGNDRASGSEIVATSGYATDGSPIVQGHNSVYGSTSGPSFHTDEDVANAFVRETATGADFVASVTSFDADGITVNVTTGSAVSGNRNFHIMFFG